MAKSVAMVIDMNSCVGCMACVVACIMENVARQAGEGVEMPEKSIAHARTKPATLGIESGLPGETPVFIQCQHCDSAPCAMVCPTGATYIDERGVVRLDTGRCVGCRACIAACPYGARTLYRGRLDGEPPTPTASDPDIPISALSACTEPERTADYGPRRAWRHAPSGPGSSATSMRSPLGLS